MPRRKFERRHYLAIAEVVVSLAGILAETDRRRVALRFADRLGRDARENNRPFPRGEFMRLCEVRP